MINHSSSFEAWLLPKSETQGTLYSILNEDKNAVVFNLELTATRAIQFTDHTGNTVDTGATVLDADIWALLTFSMKYDFSAKLYTFSFFNGGTALAEVTATSAQPVFIDAAATTTDRHFVGAARRAQVFESFFTGFIYEYTIYQYARSSTDSYAIDTSACDQDSRTESTCGSACPETDCLSTCDWN
jgi:hypothetical protein